LPWSPPAVVARLKVGILGTETPISAPALFRYAGPFVGGEKQHVVQVVPELSVRVAPELSAVAVEGPARALQVRAFVQHNAAGEGEATVRLPVPDGWSVEPAEVRLHFAYEGEEIAARFRVTPPGTRTPGEVTLPVVAARGGREYRQVVQEVAYDHIQRRQRLVPAEVRVLLLDVRVGPDASVGYVTGSAPTRPGATSGPFTRG
jgi:hypothetical protein